MVGKKNFLDRIKGLINKDQFKNNRLSPIYSIGENSNPSVKCNRKFYIQDLNTIIFKPNKNTKILLKIKTSGKYQQYLNLLMLHQNQRDLSITYRLSTEYIWISFDENILKEIIKPFKPIKNRIISIDLNPNYIGYSIIDWINSESFNVVDKGVLSLKDLNDYDNKLKVCSNDSKKLYISNKRKFEVFQCCKFLIEKMKHYRCSVFAVEDLNIKSKDNDKGRKFNRLVNNQWNRNSLINNLEKYTSIYNVELIKIKPEYSSFIGNIVYRTLKYPDMILSSIEISRRAYEFYHQYILKDKNKEKNIVWLNLSKQIKGLIDQSLEELNINYVWRDLYDLYSYLKNCKCKYRVPLESFNPLKSFSQKSLKFRTVFNRF